MKKYFAIILLFCVTAASNAFAQVESAKPEASSTSNPASVAPNTKFKSVQQKNVMSKEKQELEAMKNGVEVADIYVACKYYFSKLFNTRENVSRKNICNGYFFGSASMLLLLQDEKVNTSTCMPMDVSTEEIIKVFLKWADENPDKNKMLASVALLEIIRENYPCNEYTPKEKAKEVPKVAE